MTREELESKFDDCFDANTRATDGGYGADTTSRVKLWESFHPIISEYTKQQAIEFDFWKRQNGYTIDPSGEWYIKLTVVGDLASTKAVLVDEVYNQFIGQQNKP